MVRKTFLDLLETLQNSDLNARLKQQYQPFKALIREDSTRIERLYSFYRIKSKGIDKSL